MISVFSKKVVLLVLFFGSMLILAEAVSAFSYNFAVDSALQEAGAISQSTSSYWWLSSGGYLKLYSSRGHTNEGDLPAGDFWRLLYAQNNPTDTDNGYHPQNIFRLTTKEKWQNMRQEAYFRITRDNLSPSPNRDRHNGLLLFNRYQDQNNLYYTGIRVDGSAVIKKKQNGVYTTLAQVYGIYPGTYNRDTKPSLLPKNAWIGVRSELINNADGSVTIKLYTDKNWNGVWTLVAQATDSNNPITNAGYGGIRTDFMDVTFDNFRAESI